MDTLQKFFLPQRLAFVSQLSSEEQKSFILRKLCLLTDLFLLCLCEMFPFIFSSSFSSHIQVYDKF
jgi:hypothetical protein